MKKILLVAVLTLFTFALKAQQYHNGHQYVDLGLSVKWATCNVGADSPEEYGNYYAWGETVAKDIYDYSHYKYCNGTFSFMTKYCVNSDQGKVDNKTSLDLSDDAVRVNWGGTWRLPTKEEFAELFENCVWTIVAQNGITGFKALSKKNGNSIFLPFAGFKSGNEIHNCGEKGLYLSSSLNPDYNDYVYMLCISSLNGVQADQFSRRMSGLPIRPVCK